MAFKSRLKCLFLKPFFCILFATFLHFARNTTTNCGKYDTVTCEDSAVQIQNGTAKYALYPVWILNTKWKGENYSFAMNGQTGKFVGNLPENKSLVYLYYVVVTLLGSVLAYIVILIMSWGK